MKNRFTRANTSSKKKFFTYFQTMADSELDALRAKRLAELQRQQQQAGGDKNDRNTAEEQRQQQEDMRNTMLSSLLTQEARARLNTIALTKPEKGRMIEDILIQNARRGVFSGGKVRNFKKQIKISI
jgi:programmed cell death protein 5